MLQLLSLSLFISQTAMDIFYQIIMHVAYVMGLLKTRFLNWTFSPFTLHSHCSLAFDDK